MICRTMLGVLAIVLFAGPLPVFAATFEIELSQGWNLITLPNQQREVDPEVVTESIHDNLEQVWGVENGRWRAYFPNQPGFSDLVGMDAGNGYWVLMSQADTLVGEGLSAPSTMSLDDGWNLIGYTGQSEIDIDAIIDPGNTCVNSIWSYNQGQWLYYDVAQPAFSDLTSLEPKKGYWFETSGDCRITVDLTIPPTTRVLGDLELNELVSITGTEIVFNGTPGVLGEVLVGDSLVAPPTAMAEQGFLVTVTGLTMNAGQLIVDIGPGELDKAVTTGAVGETFLYQPDQVKISDGRGLTRGLPPKRAPRSEMSHLRRSDSGRETDEELRNPVEVIIDVTYEIQPGQSVSFEGAVAFEPEFLLNITWEDAAVTGFTAAFTGRLDGSVAVSGSQDLLSVEHEWEIGHPIRFSTIVLWAGWVPITITPQLQFVVGAEGNVSLEASTEVGAFISASAGIAYTQANGWETIRQFDYEFYWDPIDVELAASVKAYVGPHLEFQVYELFGPYVGVHGFGEFVASTSPPPFEVFIGAELTAGIADGPILDFLGIDVSYEFPLSAEVRFPIYPGETGSIVGSVQDDTGAPLALVVVGVFEDHVHQSVLTDDTGAFLLDLPPGHYSEVCFSKAGYRENCIADVSVSSGQPVNLSIVSLTLEGEGQVTGTITDAISTSPVPDMTLLLREGRNNSSGGIVAYTYSDASGQYVVDDLDAGSYTVEVFGSGYLRSYFNIQCVAGTSTGNQNGTVTPIGANPMDLRIVLTWGATPNDLDSHLTGPIDGSSGRFHVYYSNRGSLTASPWAFLDVDDVSSYGPETITVSQIFPGVYRYAVKNFGAPVPSSTLSQSEAHVDVYRGSDLWYSFDVPGGEGTWWTVFEYENGALYPVNSMGYDQPEYSIIPSAPSDEKGPVSK